MQPRVYRALVIGGGVVGLAALERLSACGTAPLALVETRSIGHARGSSHGAARIARSTYPDALFVRLMLRARAEHWPRLEASAGARLLHDTDMCLFGPPEGPFESYARAVAEAGAPIERIDAREAARRFRELDCAGAAGALHDRSAAIVDAARTLEALRRLARERGAEILEGTRCIALDLARDPIRVETEQAALHAERVVVAAGGWTARLVPELAPRLCVLRQHVGYFDYAGERALGRFAPFAWLGPGENGIHYGLPAFGGAGIKAACHRTLGAADDPDAQLDAERERLEIEALRRALAPLLVRELGPTLRSETCLYTMTPSEDFVLALHPRDPRAAIGAGLSGHGFKFAPLLGQALAELVLRGRSGIEEIEAEPARFAVVSLAC